MYYVRKKGKGVNRFWFGVNFYSIFTRYESYNRDALSIRDEKNCPIETCFNDKIHELTRFISTPDSRKIESIIVKNRRQF